MTIINKDVEFQLLPTNEVLVSVTVSVGEPGQNDMTTVVRQRISCDEFCAKAFPIMHQNYNSWPPDLAEAPAKPIAKLPPATPSSPSPPAKPIAKLPPATPSSPSPLEQPPATPPPGATKPPSPGR